MSDSILVAFKADSASEDKAVLYCKTATEMQWPEGGAEYSNWKQLLGSMAENLERQESEFRVLQQPGYILKNQLVPKFQLFRFGFPNLNLISEFPSNQAFDV
jgi:hypothetical protein